MKKYFFRLTLFNLILSCFFITSCKKNSLFYGSFLEENVQLVPIDSARKVAVNFNPSIFFDVNNTSNNSSFRSSLTGNNTVKDVFIIKDHKGIPAIYIFNFYNNNGFLFVSADYQVAPILAFFERGEFKKDTVPSAIIEWAGKMIKNIETLRAGLHSNSINSKIIWKDYFNQKRKSNLSRIGNSPSPNIVAPPPPTDPCQSDPNYYSSTTRTVGPLLPITWGQDCSYNNLCPNNNCNDCSSNAVTGCVATAMSQIIRFWQPNNSYNYNYTSMPSTSGNGEVQRLMHDAGVTVSMNYGCAVSGGSAADGADVPPALKNNFGFSSANRSTYGTASYMNVQSNIGAHWPVLLEGCNDQTNIFLGIWYSYQNCHEWVCDGYQETDVVFCMNNQSVSEGFLYFHMNWGWHEVNVSNDYNGWFAFNNWTITGAGQNNSNLDFKYAQDMVTEIHP